MLPHDCLRAYRNNAILTASPAHLVLMLYDGALRALQVAVDGFGRPESDGRRIEVINGSLLKAQSILSELRGNLDHGAGGEVAQSLDRLYEYYLRRLEQANIFKDMQRVTEVQRLLQNLRDGWAEMLTQGHSAPADGVRRTA